MKKCVLIHINEGHKDVLQNENFMFIERYTKTEEIIEQYLSQGYEVKQIIPEYSPEEQGEGNYTFYKSGVTIYFERNVSD